MQLRPYQTECVERLLAKFREYTRLLAVLPTGAGKTIILAALAHRMQPLRSLVIAHREELITQAVDKIRTATGLEAEVEKAESRASLDAPVVVASVQTLAREQRRGRWPRDHFGLIVIDECFPVGTPIDGRPIEGIRAGDLITAYDHAAGTVVRRKVKHVFRRQTDRVCRIHLSDGRLVVCTPCHPFWDGTAYVPAGRLTPQSVVHGITQNHTGPLQTLRQDGGLPGAQAELSQSQRNSDERGLLLSGMQGRPGSGDQFEDGGPDKPAICPGENAPEKPDAQPGIKSADANDTEGDAMDAACQGWQRQASHGGADAVGVCPGLGNGGSSAYGETSSKRLSDLLQAGHREPGTASGSRGGWRKPLLAVEAGTGPEEGGIAPVARVERVEVFQRGSDPEFERLCPGGVVFNLEVEEHHNYFAYGILVHNCHHALAESYQSVVGHFHDHAKVLGVTATPDRGDKRSLSEYFQEVGFEIGLHDLIKQGYLCRITVKTVPLQIDLAGVRTVAGDFNDADLGDAIEPYLRQIIAEMKAAIGSRKTLVFLPLIRTSQRFVELCREAGLTAEHVDGQSEDRQAILARYAAGEFQILANSLLLTEGFDEPSVSCVVCLRPTKIRAMYSQIIGRGTRLHETKENLLVLDFLWHTERHTLVRPAHLVASSTAEADAITEILEAAAREFGPGEGGAEEQDLLDLIDDAKEQREAKLARELAQNARRRGQQLDPVEFALSLHAMDLAEWEPTMRWHEEPPTDRQLSVLMNLGFAPAAIRSKGYASQLLDRIFTRKELKLASPKQVTWLRRTGYPSPETATMEEAKAYLSQQFTR